MVLDIILIIVMIMNIVFIIYTTVRYEARLESNRQLWELKVMGEDDKEP